MKKILESGESCACFNLRKAARAISQMYDEAFRPTGLGANQLSLIAVTAALEPVTVKRLAEATVMDRTTVTRNLKPLEKQGLLRIHAGEDRRERVVSLTPNGKKKLQEARPIWRALQARVAKGLGPERMTRLLEDLAAAVKAARAG